MEYTEKVLPDPLSIPARQAAGPAVVALRLAAALLGGYAFCWGFVSLAIAGLGATGATYEDASQLAMMLAFPLFLVLFLWAFAARSLHRVWLVLFAGAVTLTLAAHWLAARAVLSG